MFVGLVYLRYALLESQPGRTLTVNRSIIIFDMYVYKWNLCRGVEAVRCAGELEGNSGTTWATLAEPRFQ